MARFSGARYLGVSIGFYFFNVLLIIVSLLTHKLFIIITGANLFLPIAQTCHFQCLRGENSKFFFANFCLFLSIFRGSIPPRFFLQFLLQIINYN